MTQTVNTKVLLVEDSEPLRKILAEKLKDEHFEVIECGGGEEGEKKAIEIKPDVIITDLVMFPVDGVDMAMKIRAHDTWGKNVKIVALTNQNMTEEEERIKRADFSAYYVKAETSLDEVVSKVKDIIRSKSK